MSSTMSTTTTILLTFALLLCLTTPVAAFGSGKIAAVSSVAGKNWRHGDIEDTLLELFLSSAGRAKFDNLAVKRVYFGNWLRDYSQALDVGGLKQLPKDTIRIMLWVLSFVTFGFATGEFEVTEERLGVYRPEEHIDNPKDYADNEDARKYDSRLRAPVDEGRELAIDQNNGMKVYIASENQGFETSAAFVRAKFTKAIELGRAYGRDGNDNDLYEALRQLGTGLHTLEDFSAHSNYIELALKEMGVDVFAHVGQNVRVNVNGKDLQPIVTGTFGMTDFLHSMVGEVSDKLMQSEVQDLEGKLQEAANKSKNGQTSSLKKILDKIPFRLLGLGNDDFAGQVDQIQQASDAKELETKATITPGSSNTEEIKRQAQQTIKDIYPILEFHDKVMKAVTEGIDKIPGANELLENLTGAMQIYIFSVLAPYIVPVLDRVKVELSAGSSGILQSSEKGQYVVFNDHDSSNPTHSMISKDHFTNVLNEPAGLIASEVVRIVVPLITSAWDDSSKDVNQICDEAIKLLHHPALRNGDNHERMFRVVEGWWNQKSQREQETLKEQLSRDGVKEGKNHTGEDPVGGPGSASHSHSSCNHNHGGGSSGYSQASNTRQQQQNQPQISQREREGREEREREEHNSSRQQQQGAKTLDKVVPGLVGGLLKGFGLDIGGGGGSDNNSSESTSHRRANNGPKIPGLSGLQQGISGGNQRQEENYSSGYGERQQENQSSGYNSGRQQETTQSSYGGNQSSEYGNNSRREEAQPSYGGRNNNDDREEETRSSGYGGGRQQENTQSSYGGRTNREEETRSSGYGGSDRQQEYGGYGGGRSGREGGREEETRSSGYGGRQQQQDSYGEQESQSEGYGGMGRHHQDDDEQRGGGGGYGQEGYGGRQEGGGGW